jgi:hypothetical protein
LVGADDDANFATKTVQIDNGTDQVANDMFLSTLSAMQNVTYECQAMLLGLDETVGSPSLGVYAGRGTMGQCAEKARKCSAAALAFGDGIDNKTECWFVDNSTLNAVVPATSNGTVNQNIYEFCKAEWDPMPNRIEFALVCVYGVAGIFFAFRFLRLLFAVNVSKLQRHTVWLTHVPTRDRDDGQLFELKSDEFKRVGRDLSKELARFIKQRWEAEFQSQNASNQLLYSAPAKSIDEAKEGQIVQEVYVVHAHDHEGNLAGHAFAVLSKEIYVRLLLTRGGFMPSWCHMRDHTLFKFGIPPWAAVTLRCQRAPPPSDIAWDNLHITKGYQVVGRVLQFLLLLFAVFVSPPDVEKALSPTVQSWQATGYIDSNIAGIIITLLKPASALLMLLVNSIILPFVIEMISDSLRPQLKSKSQSYQFQLNCSFLILTTIIVPMLHLAVDKTSIYEQIKLHTDPIFSPSSSNLYFSDHIYALCTYIGTELRATYAKCDLFQSYLWSAILVTNGSQLCQFGVGFARSLGVTCPYPFAWGYWYAWSTCIMYLCLTTSVLLPVMLPLGAIYFLVTRAVHRANLRRGAFESPEMDMLFESRVAASMVQAVSFFWFTMALAFMSERKPGRLEGDAYVYVPYPNVTIVSDEPHFLQFTGLLLSSQERLICAGVLLLFGLFSLSASVFLLRGWLERFLFRRFGGQGPDRLICLLCVVPVPLLMLAFCVMPQLEWRTDYDEMQEHNFFALCLIVFGIIGRLVARATICVQSRRTRVHGKIRRHLNSTVGNALEEGNNDFKFSSQTTEDFVQDFAKLRKEEATTIAELVEEGQWYRPPTRATSSQHDLTGQSDVDERASLMTALASMFPAASWGQRENSLRINKQLISHEDEDSSDDIEVRTARLTPHSAPRLKTAPPAVARDRSASSGDPASERFWTIRSAPSSLAQSLGCVAPFNDEDEHVVPSAEESSDTSSGDDEAGSEGGSAHSARVIISQPTTSGDESTEA